MGTQKPTEPTSTQPEGNSGEAKVTDVPLSLDVLADLHAGVFGPTDATVLRQRAEEDSHAGATLDGLDRLQTALSAWADSPAPEAPSLVVDRVIAALRAETANSALPRAQAGATTPSAPAPNLVTGPTLLHHRRHPPRKRSWITYSAAGLGVAAAVAATLVGLHMNDGNKVSKSAAAPSDDLIFSEMTAVPHRQAAVSPTGVKKLSARLPLSDTQISALVGRTPAFGELHDAGRRASCLTGLGLSESTPVLGAETMNINGPAVLMVLPAGRPGELMAIAVRPTCNQSDPKRVAQTRIGTSER